MTLKNVTLDQLLLLYRIKVNFWKFKSENLQKPLSKETFVKFFPFKTEQGIYQN